MRSLSARFIWQPMVCMWNLPALGAAGAAPPASPSQRSTWPAATAHHGLAAGITAPRLYNVAVLPASCILHSSSKSNMAPPSGPQKSDADDAAFSSSAASGDLAGEAAVTASRTTEACCCRRPHMRHSARACGAGPGMPHECAWLLPLNPAPPQTPVGPAASTDDPMAAILAGESSTLMLWRQNFVWSAKGAKRGGVCVVGRRSAAELLVPPVQEGCRLVWQSEFYSRLPRRNCVT